MSKGFLVKTELRGTNPKLPKYPLLPDDLLVQDESGKWWKECPGAQVGGFEPTPEQVAALVPVDFQRRGLDYYWKEPSHEVVL